MEEFKTAHSKMFNKLRQTSAGVNNNNNSQQMQCDAEVVYDDDDAKRSNSKNSGGNKRNPISGTTSTNLVIRPRATVATN